MDEVVERVLAAVELVPRGCVVSYGDIAELVGSWPRQVGRIMGEHGGGVPWWRVTNASGDLPAWLRSSAAPHWSDEGIAWKPSGLGCRIASYRADLAGLADAYELAVR